ncbi:GTP pyrophosphokinase family protein [Rhodococcus sovatensis]|uniref:GTP pyrophosphokinase family protein n=1 Tax=Rhodococcus sovatensis TaxID=1805840 RepID=A0ABZ2PJN7_9NOCA
MESNTTDNGSKAVELADFDQLRSDFTRFMMSYKFGIDELMTKINILKEEFTHIHRYSPIEHVGSRLKTPESIIVKARRKNCPLTLDDIRTNIVDIAGIRITCSFISDTYRIADMIGSQTDVRVLEVKDYIAAPKPNGYKSLHLIVEIPVFMSDRIQPVPVELQIRTIAMDFWASLEHKIFYKYHGTIPAPLLAELTEAADSANRLDVTMERLHDEVAEIKGGKSSDAIHLDSMPPLSLPRELLIAMLDGSKPL